MQFMYTYLASKSKDSDAKTPHHEADTISWNKSGVFDPKIIPRLYLMRVCPVVYIMALPNYT